MDNSRICHHLVFHDRGKQNFVQPFLRSRKLLRLPTHTLGLNFTLTLWAHLWHLWVFIMHGPYLKRTQLLCMICNICEQPALVCHGPQLPCVRLNWVIFVLGFLHTYAVFTFSTSTGVELDSEGSIVSTCTETWILTSFSTCANLKCTCTFVYPFVQFKVLAYGHTYVSKQTDRHTHASCNAVPLVWGSLRFAPTILTIDIVATPISRVYMIKS